MNDPQIFRCPFEVQGILNDTIVTVTLFGNRAMRLRLMRDAMERLRVDRTRTAVRFVLPESVMAKCDSHTLLQRRILPYQLEYLAASLDLGLAPFLPHQSWWKRRLGRLMPRWRFRRLGAYVLTRALARAYSHAPRTISDFCSALSAMFKEETMRGERYPEFVLGTLVRDKRQYFLLRAELAAFAIYQDQTRLKDPAYNDALFSIVKSPLYPIAFGRFSTRVEIIVTRDVDVAMLPTETTFRLRKHSNAVHAAHGIRIRDLERNQVGVGFWNPDDAN